MSKLLRNGEDIKHLFIYVTIIKNYQDQFQEHRVQMDVKWPKRMPYSTIIFYSERPSNEKQTLDLTEGEEEEKLGSNIFNYRSPLPRPY